MCVQQCVELVAQLESGVPLAIDTGDRILLEYLGRLNTSGRSGPAATLAIRLWRTRLGAREHLHAVDVTPIGDYGEGFEEVPEALRDFDLDDLKFIAVAVAEECKPEIYLGLDGEWWDRRRDFVEAGVDLQFLCSADLR